MTASYATDTSILTMEGASSGRVRLTGLAPPVNASDAITLQYYESSKEGLDVRESVRIVIQTNLGADYNYTETTITKAANGAIGSTIQVALSLNDRVLIMGQANGVGSADESQNGIYYVSALGDGSNPFVLTRASDMIDSSQVEGGIFTFCEQGTSANHGFCLTGTHYSALSGTVSLTNGSTTVTGSGTSFSSTCKVAQGLEIDGHKYLISSITSDTVIVITEAALTTVSGATAKVGPKFALTSGQLDGAENDDMVFTQFSGAGQMSASSPIQLSDAGVISVINGAIANAKLTNSAVTLTAGSGLATTSASVSLGDTATLSVNVDDSTIEIDSDSLRLKDSGITAAKLANNAVTNDKILDGTIANAKMASATIGVVGGDGIASTTSSISLGGSTTLSVSVDDSTLEIASGSVRVKDLGVTNDKLAGSIANAKLANSSMTITAGNGLTTTAASVALGGSATLAVAVDDSTIEINSDSLRLKDSGVTNAKLANSSLTVAAGDGLATTSGSIALGASSTLSVNVDDSTIEINSDSLRVKDSGITNAKLDNSALTVAAGSGLSSTSESISLGASATLSVNVDDSTVEINSDSLRVKDSGVTNAKLANSALTVAAGDGLSTTAGSISLGGSSTLSVNVDDSSIELSSDSLRVKASGVTNSMLANSALTVTAGDGLSTTAASISLGSSASLSVNVDDSTIELSSDSVQLKAGGITNSHVNASAAIAISKLAASTISGVSLGANLNAHTLSIGSNGLTLSNSGTTFNGSAAVAHQIALPQNLTTSGTPTFDTVTCTGNATANQFIATSDARLKQDINVIDDPVGMIGKITPCFYKWNESACNQHGFQYRPEQEFGLLAQQVGEHLPGVVGQIKDGFMGIDYSRLTALLVGCIQKQQKDIDDLKAHLL